MLSASRVWGAEPMTDDQELVAVDIARAYGPEAVATFSEDARAIATWVRLKASGATQDAYTRDVASFWGSTNYAPWPELGEGDVLDWLSDMGDLSPATRTRRLAALRSATQYLYEEGRIGANFCKRIKLPTLRNTLNERILSRDDIVAMRIAAQSPRDAAMIWVGYITAARVSELTALRWRDISPTGAVTIYGKGAKTRYAALGPAELGMIEPLRGDYDTAPVFRSRNAPGILSRVQVREIVRTAARKAGVACWDRVSPHWLRHAHASHAVAAHVDLSVIQATLGHSDPKTTAGYIHIRAENTSSNALFA